MRVLLGHTYYRSSAPSGEDAVFRNEQEMLEAQGVDVVSFERFNDDLDDSSLGQRLRVGVDTVWSRRAYREVGEILERVKPDVAHFHNTFPQMSPSVYAACQANGTPVVQTLHNYRLICPGPMLLRKGRPCEDCVGRIPLPALRHRCYRESLLATGALFNMIVYNRLRGSYRRMVNRYIALTQFAAGRMVAGGLPAGRMEVKPNFLFLSREPKRERSAYAVYVGRLSEEKGVNTLLDAWSRVPTLRLKVLGDGPLRGELEARSSQKGLNVEFLGQRSRVEVLDIVGAAALQVVPSEWYEGFPMVVLEAYATGTPVLASRIGSLAEVVEEDETGLLFEPGNATDLAAKVNALWTSADTRMKLSAGARAVYETKYTPERNYEMLMGIYERAIEDFRRYQRL